MNTGHIRIMNLSKRLGFGVGCFGLVLAGLLLGGCQSGPSRTRFTDVPDLAPAPQEAPPLVAAAPPPNAPTTTPAAPVASTNTSQVVDLLSDQEALTITFTDLPYVQPPVEDRIKADGTITLLQNQTFHAAGKTRSELEREIHDRYVPRFFKTLTVTVLPSPQTRFYYVDGEVKQPGRQVYLSRMTVLKAISSAGGFTDFAKKTAVELTRADGRKFTINSKKAQKEPRLDLEVFPDDKVWVPRSWL